MYNEQLKKEFLEQYKIITNVNFIENIFNKCEPYEKLYKKDVCNFIREEILELCKSFGLSSLATLRTRISILNSYTNYCCENQMSIDNINHYLEVTKNDLQLCLNQFLQERRYITEEVLQEYLLNIINPCDQFLLCAFYEGFAGKNYEEISEVVMSDFDLKNKTVTLCTGRTIPVSDQLIRYAAISANTYVYSSGKLEGSNNPKLADIPNVFKYRKNVSGADIPENAKRRIIKRIAKIKKDLNAPEITIPRLKNSGFISKIKKEAKLNGMKEIDFLYSDEASSIKEIYGVSLLEKYMLNERYREYLD